MVVAQVLIVDDCSDNILAVQKILHEFNIDSEFSKEGNEALNMVQNMFEHNHQVYKLIFIDFGMPECDGPEIARNIRGYLNDHSSSE